MYATDSQIVQNKKKEFPSEEEEGLIWKFLIIEYDILFL